MKLLELQTVRPPIGALDAIEAALISLFRREFYLPLLAEIGERGKLLKNTHDELMHAIASGRIQWVDGHFEGQLTATLSRDLRAAGATWDFQKKRWKFSSELLTPDFKMAIGQASSEFRKMAEKVDTALARISPTEFAGQLNLGRLFDATLYRIDRRISETVRSITVTPTISDEERLVIGQKYTADMQRYIQEWTGREIVKLRERVQEHVLSGARADSLAKIIKTSYGESLTHSKFLARQETNLFLSEFKQTRYARAGVTEYIWHCLNNPKQSKNGPYLPHMVRYDHAILDGTLQKWSNPPVTNQKTGARNHPGCDFGPCRCYDRPVVKF